MRRIENHMIKRTISEREGTKIRNNIRLDFQPPTVAQLSVKRPVIHENRTSVVRVKPHHAATRRHIKNAYHFTTALLHIHPRW
jgi:hypothetical protein